MIQCACVTRGDPCAKRQVPPPAANPEPAALARLEKLCRVDYADGRQDSVRRFLRANTDLHAGIARMAGNRRIVKLLIQLLSEGERLINFGMLSHPQSEQTVSEHERLLAALAARDGASARQIMEEHVRATRRMVVESLIANTNLREVPIGVQLRFPVSMPAGRGCTIARPGARSKSQPTASV